MTTDHAPSLTSQAAAPYDTLPGPVARMLALFFERFTAGTLVVELPSGKRIIRRAAHGPEAVFKIARWRALSRLVARGDIGFAEGYMAGDWTTPDLAALFAWAQVNENALSPAWAGSAVQRLADRFRHIARANTRRGSRRNIAAHYDLGNDFYAAWLDPSMSYSSALYSDAAPTLEAAQSAKIDRAIELLEVTAGTKVLEIGCGWGALAERLIATHGSHVTGLTLSHEQLAYASARLRDTDPTGTSAIMLKDYRDIAGTFDRIVSIEMLEAAGEKNWPAYFAKLRDCLNPGGVAVIQVITIEEPRFEAYRRRPDFIQRYIFPGGMLPTVQHMRELTAGAGLKLDHVELFGQSYARTLADWRERFLAAWPGMRGATGTERFRRMWEYYFSYCEIGFKTGATDVGLYRVRRPCI
ncbi:MAG: cyclopropane-fatty-acyl-phospholipid synthase family protein [Hyphomicrobium sp.]